MPHLGIRSNFLLSIYVYAHKLLLPELSREVSGSIYSRDTFLRHSFSVESFLSPGCPETSSIDQAGLKLRDPPASASRVLRLKVCTTTIWLLPRFLGSQSVENMTVESTVLNETCIPSPPWVRGLHGRRWRKNTRSRRQGGVVWTLVL